MQILSHEQAVKWYRGHCLKVKKCTVTTDLIRQSIDVAAWQWHTGTADASGDVFFKIAMGHARRNLLLARKLLDATLPLMEFPK